MRTYLKSGTFSLTDQFFGSRNFAPGTMNSEPQLLQVQLLAPITVMLADLHLGHFIVVSN